MGVQEVVKGFCSWSCSTNGRNKKFTQVLIWKILAKHRHTKKLYSNHINSYQSCGWSISPPVTKNYQHVYRSHQRSFSSFTRSSLKCCIDLAWSFVDWLPSKLYIKIHFLPHRERSLQKNTQFVNALQENNCCLLQTSYETYKYTVWANCGVFKCYRRR